VFDSVVRPFKWFIDGLVESCAALEGSRRRRVAIVRSGNGYALEQPNGKQGRELLRIDEEGGRHFKPPEQAAALRHRDVDIVLPADEVLVRTLDPLPGESRQYLDSIVQHQLERVAPWRTDDVLHTYRVAPAERGNDRLLVTIIATARSMHERVIEAVRAAQPREIRLLCRDTGVNGGVVPIPVDRGAAAAARQKRLRLAVIAALGVLIVAILGGGGLLGWSLYTTDAELEQVTEQVAAQRKKIVAARASTPAGDVDLKSLVQRRARTPFVVVALDALAGALPDDTWLSELRLSEGRMRMTGISRNVAGLVPLIEASPAFAEATFFAPTTRLPAGQGDRFHLETRLTADKAKP
jgi:general secretion pathway protein L